MTNDKLIALSEKVAELYGVDLHDFVHANKLVKSFLKGNYTYLYQDLGRVMELAIEHETWPSEWRNWIFVTVPKGRVIEELIADHPTKEQAVIVAIMKALMAKKESEK